ncbi:MAG: dihydrofolate reductase [Myxococcales bacterium]|nr:dihydrofolate reductase [Myxococcales bacterium]
MRTLRVFESISIDGYFADAHGDMSWAHGTAPDPEYGAWVGRNAGSGRALLLGRATYEMMAAFWPSPMATEQMPDVARGMNAATKYLVSRTLTPTWSNTLRLEGDLVEAVRALKASPGPDLVVLGSGSVVTQLGEAGLVDEYQLVVIPVALGGGRTVFSRRQPLELVEQRAFPGGNVVVTYAAAAAQG